MMQKQPEDESLDTKKIRHAKSIVALVSTSVVSATGLGIGVWLMATGQLTIGASIVSSIVGVYLPTPYDLFKTNSTNVKD